MIAVRDNPPQAAALGIDVVRTKLTAFVLSGVLAAGAGFSGSPGSARLAAHLPPVRSLSIVAAVVIGGLGTVPGAVLGAFYMSGHSRTSRPASRRTSACSSTGVGLLTLVLFLPGRARPSAARCARPPRSRPHRLEVGQPAAPLPEPVLGALAPAEGPR